MNEILTPPMIEQKIFETANKIAKSITVRHQARKEAMTAKRIYDTSYATEFLKADGSIEIRRQKAIQRTSMRREIYDEAEIAHKYAESQAKALEMELSALQSISSSVRETFRTAGIGER